MPLINCEISPDLTWSKKCVISSAVGITENIVTLSTEDNVKLLE